jgi:two-component system chemotaxis response regulator CheY
VLVVEPEEGPRLEVMATVRELGHECMAAVDGETAWAAAVGIGVDVVVTQLRLAGFDGLELCRRIRALDEDSYTYVVLLTTDDEHQQALRAVRAGVDDTLMVPLDPLALETRLVVAARVTDLHRQLADRRAELAAVNEELQQSVRTDALTGLFNRRRLDEDTPVLDEGLRRYDRPYSVAMLDIDHFKAFNDRHGHQAGDDAIRLVSAAVRRAIRQGDVAYRYGGEEFLIVFPVQSLARAKIAADRVRSAVEALSLRHAAADRGVVTVSIGVADAEPAGGLVGAVARADSALYEAKAGGRNRVVLARPVVPSHINLR